MKTKFKHILVILCLSMISCEGNLEPELFDQITPENFLTNEDDVKTAVTGVYAEFRGISEWGRYKTSWGSVMTLQEVPTDLWAANWFYKAHTDFMWKATDYFVCEIFEFFVPAITKATALIARIQDAPVSDDIKNRYIAELRVVRALWMYDLFDLYGAGSGNHRPRKNTQSHSGLYGNSPLSGRIHHICRNRIERSNQCQNFACRMDR